MVKKRLLINWENFAKDGLKEAYRYIKADSLANAKKVRADILDTVTTLANYPEKLPADKYKIDNDGTYRAFELHHYRIVYRYLQTEIKVLTIRHTKMEPKEY